mmetsp:Transcript_37268/g.44480  ORF Transcript_37268/g.44480 Transcript_37268/m.44480 type:complete len:118 (+) Transcript_37268:72-425(+)
MWNSHHKIISFLLHDVRRRCRIRASLRHHATTTVRAKKLTPRLRYEIVHGQLTNPNFELGYIAYGMITTMGKMESIHHERQTQTHDRITSIVWFWMALIQDILNSVKGSSSAYVVFY